METLVVVAQQRNQYCSRVKPQILEGLIVVLFNLEQDCSRPRLKYSSTPLTKRPSSPPSSSSSPKTPSPFADGTHSKATRKSSPIPINCSRAPRNDKPFNVEIPGDGFLYSELWRIYALNSTFVFLPFHLCFGVARKKNSKTLYCDFLYCFCFWDFWNPLLHQF
uniref:Uncharacterized protein n=1 Tax=Gossypium raimondii TaxID=29730 RepID=A0A0D2QZ36_GOSRA|nr:hypothetical protein B456_009G455700 [Gossypium raimondii]